MMRLIKQLVRSAANKQGYLIGKYPTVTFNPIPVFDLAVMQLMWAEGLQRTFVQVGANDGIYGDAISKYALKYPWRGILVEPQPDVMERLKANYAGAADRLTFENAAVGQDLSELKMYRAGPDANVDPVYASTVVSGDPSVVASQLGVAQRNLEAFTVPCLSLDALLSKYNWRSLDILMIDTEGYDQEVLATIDLTRTPPLIIQLEHGHLPPHKINLAVDYLTAHGYQVLYGGHQIDTVALHESFWNRIELAQTA